MLLQSGRNSMLDGLRRMRCPPHGYDIIQLRYYSANLRNQQKQEQQVYFPRNDSFTFSHFVKSKERLAKGTLQTLMPQAVEQVPTKREEKACGILYLSWKINLGYMWSPFFSMPHSENLFGFMQALDLILYRHGRPEAINTSQNIYRMNPTYGHRTPLCVLRWGPKWQNSFRKQCMNRENTSLK